ncbi:MAG: hypothetical protein DRO96_00680 [Candidatus Aenigmatarchaeota archaeon]|nr:MAG: hypothetical protein DRO96_00680 [Candidatus Aenigmarchaeota archaeon]
MGDVGIKQLSKTEILRYYFNPDIIEQILSIADNREVVGTFYDGSYDKRPNILQYPDDIKEMVRRGIVSFHASVERWSSPMSITQNNQSQLRVGWDFILDIDSKVGIEEAKITAKMICKFLKKYGIKNYGLKFSGRRGFHICVPWEAFPKEINFQRVKNQYPAYPRIIALFIRESIAENLMKELIKTRGAKELIEVLEQPPTEMNPYYFVEVEKDWGARHLFRMPYSFNNKTWLVSFPLSENELEQFKPEHARPEKVLKSKKGPFIKPAEENEALDLLTEALDWYAAHKKENEKKPVKKRVINWEKKVSENLFPPCIKFILAGLSDGRKRSLFTIINFLRMMNWSWSEIEQRLWEWNKKNNPPLPDNIIIGQLRWNQQQKQHLPANCTNEQFYGFCCNKDELCKNIKNPVTYPFRKMKKLGITKRKKPRQRKQRKEKNEPRIGRIIKKGRIKKK